MSNFLEFPQSGSAPFVSYIYPDVPPGSSSDFGLLHDIYLIGGYQTVTSINERNQIPISSGGSQPFTDAYIDPTGFGSGRRKIGMAVYVVETDETYRLFPKGYFGNGGTGATGTASAWLALPSWEKAVLLDPTAQGIRNLTPSLGTFPPTYGLVAGSGNAEDCWVKVSTETEVTYIEAYEISTNNYGGTGTRGIVSYRKDTLYLTKFPTENSGSSFLSVDGFLPLEIKKRSSAGLISLASNDIDTSVIYPLIYDGTYFQIPIDTPSLGIYGPDGSLVGVGPTGIKFLGNGISASNDNGFITIDLSELAGVTGAAGATGPQGPPGGPTGPTGPVGETGPTVAVYDVEGDLLTTGLTGIRFTGVGVTVYNQNDFVVVGISGSDGPSTVLTTAPITGDGKNSNISILYKTTDFSVDDNKLALNLDFLTLVTPTISPSWTVKNNNDSTPLSSYSVKSASSSNFVTIGPYMTGSSIELPSGAYFDFGGTAYCPTPSATQTLPTGVSGDFTFSPTPPTGNQYSQFFTESSVTGTTTYNSIFTSPNTGLQVSGTQVIRATGSQTKSSSVTVTYRDVFYWGVSSHWGANPSLPSSLVDSIDNATMASIITGLTNLTYQFGTKAQTLNSVTTGSGQRLVFAYPSSYADIVDVATDPPSVSYKNSVIKRSTNVTLTTISGLSTTYKVYVFVSDNSFSGTKLIIS